MLALLLLTTLLSVVNNSLATVDTRSYKKLQSNGILVDCSTDWQIRSRSLIICLQAAKIDEVGDLPRRLIRWQAASKTCSIVHSCSLTQSPINNTNDAFYCYNTCHRYLLYSVKAGIGVSVWQTFSNSIGCNNSHLPLNFGQSPSVRLWRSCSLDSKLPELLDNSRHRRIVVEVLNEGQTMATIRFRGRGGDTNITNWFSRDTVIDSYPDVSIKTQPTFTHFSIFGFVKDLLIRRFYINFYHEGCENDRGFLAAVDADVCEWAGLTSDPPSIVYNPTGGNWMANYKIGDHLIVYVE